MKLNRKTVAFALFIISAIFAFTSCSKKIGYSVVLWSIPEENLSDGTIVPVYIKSNISHCYVIGIPDTELKCEVPLWKISEPTSKRKVVDVQKKYAEYQHYYASVKRDGLPIRSEPQNTSRQIYRTREGEILKVLYKGNGAVVMAGNKPLEGDWLKVLTNDGSLGWCFSYNLNVYNENEKSVQNVVAAKEENLYDDYMKKILSATWYPEEYQTMVNQRHVDLESINPEYKFETGYNSDGIVKMTSEKMNFSFPFNGITKIGNRVYRFNDSNLTMTIRTSASIFLQYVDENQRQLTVNLSALSESIDTIIERETNRRINEYGKIASAGPTFSSSSYGKINFYPDNTFSWSGYKLLTPSLIPDGAGGTGTVSIEYFLASALKSEYDGILTLKFDGNGKKVSFLYKIEPNGIRLEDVQRAKFKDKVVTEKSTNPVIIFFGK